MKFIDILDFYKIHLKKRKITVEINLFCQPKFDFTFKTHAVFDETYSFIKSLPVFIQARKLPLNL